MLKNVFEKKDRKLGVANEKRQYDLPLDRGNGTDFMILLIALMSFLALMALVASFALSAMTERWSSGLENKMTIEIPANFSDEESLAQVERILRRSRSVDRFQRLGENDISELVGPWLGEDVSLTQIPLPTLISVQLYPDADIAPLEIRLSGISADITLDRHESWLNDVLNFTGSLQLSAALISAIIGFTTIVAIAGAIRSRMALHRKEVELLHLMGASDNYITKQFQKHARTLSFQGALLGVLFGALALLLVHLFAADTTAGLLPDFKLTYMHYAVIAALPVIAALIAEITARITVLRTLALFP